MRDYAFAYLQNYALFDFRQAEHEYAAWRKQHAGQSVDKVLRGNAHWFVSTLRNKQPVNDERWWLDFDAMLNLSGSKSSYPQKAKYLRDEGLIDVLEKWHADPATDDKIKRHIQEIMLQLRKSSLNPNEANRGVSLRGESIPGLQLNKGVDQLWMRPTFKTAT